MMGEAVKTVLLPYIDKTLYFTVQFHICCLTYSLEIQTWLSFYFSKYPKCEIKTISRSLLQIIQPILFADRSS
jgi:hypothetical protein